MNSAMEFRSLTQAPRGDVGDVLPHPEAGMGPGWRCRLNVAVDGRAAPTSARPRATAKVKRLRNFDSGRGRTLHIERDGLTGELKLTAQARQTRW